MIRIRVLRLSRIIYYAVIIILAVAAVGLLYRILPGNDAGIQPYAATGTPAATAAPDNTPMPEPTGEDALFEETSALESDAGAVAVSAVRVLNVLPLEPGASPLPVQASSFNINNESEETDEQMDARMLVEILNAQGEYVRPGAALSARILIYHTHTYEAYEQDEADRYIEVGTWRTKDETYNVVRVGEELAEALRAKGIEVVHDTTAFEPPKLGTAYIRSLEALDAYTERGEVFDMYIDLHRDAYSNRPEMQPVTLQSGETAAKLMMLIGNGQGSDGQGFSIMPKFEDNLKLAQFLTEHLNTSAPGICRDVMVKTGRYNQHVSNHSVLIEVGHNKNTLREALATVPYLTEAIYDSLK